MSECCVTEPVIMDALTPLLQGSRHIWRGQHHPTEHPSIPSGHPALDQAIPGGGFPAHALSEIMGAYGAGGLSLCLPMVASVSQHSLVALINPPYTPYAPALVYAGVKLDNLLLIRPSTDKDLQWSIEQSAKQGSASMVLCWNPQATPKTQRRAQLASEQGQCTTICFRPAAHRHQSSHANLRLCIEASNTELHLELIKAKALVGSKHIRLARP